MSRRKKFVYFSLFNLKFVIMKRYETNNNQYQQMDIFKKESVDLIKYPPHK